MVTYIHKTQEIFQLRQISYIPLTGNIFTEVSFQHDFTLPASVSEDMKYMT